MAKQQSTKTKALPTQQCGSCNEIFNGKTCPNCGEKIDVFPINRDGVSTDDVANAIGATHGLPINLTRSPELFDPDTAIDTAMKQQMRDVIQEANLDKVKTLAADQAAKRLRAEETLEATKKGFMPPGQGEHQQEEQSGQQSINPALILQMLGGWDPEQRNSFLDRLSTDPMLALNLSMIMNGGKGQGNPMMGGMMNPMAMMGGMMQPQVEQAPPVDAATMVTAMITGMQALQEMGGGNKGNDAQMERLLDKMDDMHRETEELKMKIIESEQKNRGIGSDEVRNIISEVVARNSENHANIQEGVKVIEDLKSLTDGMVGLGLVQKVTQGDDKPSLDERQFDHQVKMDELRDKRNHELELKTEEAAVEKARTQGEFMTGLFSVAQQQQEEGKADTEADPKADEVVRVEARQASVIS